MNTTDHVKRWPEAKYEINDIHVYAFVWCESKDMISYVCHCIYSRMSQIAVLTINMLKPKNV